MRSSTLLGQTYPVLLLLLSITSAACAGALDGSGAGPGPGPEKDAGRSDGGGASDGSLDSGAGDASCADAACLACGAGGPRCDDGGVCRDGGCTRRCVPGSSTCAGARLQPCDDGGTFARLESCGVGALCRSAACVAVSSCAGETPPCCSTPAECAGLAEFFTCSECRPTIRRTACLAGACQDLPAPIDFTVLATAAALPDPTRIASGVITLYRGTTADGRRADCATLLDPATGSTPHDARDPQLDPTLSRPYEFTGGTGNDLFTTLLLGAPGGGDQTIVFSVYDGSRGRGLRLGRGCLDHATPEDGATLSLELLP